MYMMMVAMRMDGLGPAIVEVLDEEGEVDHAKVRCEIGLAVSGDSLPSTQRSGRT